MTSRMQGPCAKRAAGVQAVPGLPVLGHLAVAVALLFAACHSEPPPNVVLLVMDTTRGDRCSINGYERRTTPELARIAAEGTLYRNAWSPAGWTGPAHASMFTGLRPEHHGFLRANRSYLAPESSTLAERFRSAGYGTGCFTNNTTLSPEFGLTQGFDEVVPLYSDKERPYPWAPETHRRALDWAVEVAVSGRPFFLVVNDMEPHFPYTPPEADALRFLPPRLSATRLGVAMRMTFDDHFRHNVGVRRIPAPRLSILSDLYDA